MRPTSQLPSLTIAFRRAEMTAFWILATALLSVAFGLASAGLGMHAPWAWAAVGLSLLLPGLFWSRWFEVGIRGWNKGVRVSSAVLRAYVLRVCYYLLFTALSAAGSSLHLALGSGEVSRWIPRARGEFSFSQVSSTARDDWSDGLAKGWSNAWMVCLLPVLWLLRLLRDEGLESAPPSSTYTLY